MTQIPLSSGASAERPQADLDRDDNTREIVSDVAYRQLAIVNVVFVGIEKAGSGRYRNSRLGPGNPQCRPGEVWGVRQARMRCDDARAFRSRWRTRNPGE
jgi:hypothetical protein